jgi:hypothetical protein
VDLSRVGYFFQVETVERPLYLKPHARVNTNFTHFLRPSALHGIGRRETTAQRDPAACTARSGANSVRLGQDRSLITSPIARILAPGTVATVSARAWDEAVVSAEA